ncbi:hypothetical protein MSG28_015909 [Choristoneura fumiferana]|uniref:Uncharacterized protein n=1 Tax=Choristoneura fumiferana TaxID=7141 RepID=A0ACC0K5E9_CHOFU|nr:hypothetical protein MSG28_015909 [Choristoneura fumiferana]
MLRAGARHPDAGPSTSSDAMDMEQVYATLNEYLQMEHKFQPNLCLPNESENGEVTTGARDGAAHVIRCLKVWYDLPADVPIDAISLLDRFLTKMKVRPCHVPCITVACMNIAIEQYAQNNKEARKVSIEELVGLHGARRGPHVAWCDKLALASARARRHRRCTGCGWCARCWRHTAPRTSAAGNYTRNKQRSRRARAGHALHWLRLCARCWATLPADQAPVTIPVNKQRSRRARAGQIPAEPAAAVTISVNSARTGYTALRTKLLNYTVSRISPTALRLRCTLATSCRR